MFQWKDAESPAHVYELVKTAPNIVGPWEFDDHKSIWSRAVFTRGHGLLPYIVQIQRVDESDVGSEPLAFDTPTPSQFFWMASVSSFILDDAPYFESDELFVCAEDAKRVVDEYLTNIGFMFAGQDRKA